MSKRVSLILIFTLAAMVFLVSCQRSASQAPEVTLATPTVVANTPTLAQITPLSQIDIIQTQTAVFQQTNMITPAVNLPSPTFASTPAGTVIPPTGVAGTPVAGITPVVTVPPMPATPLTYTLQQGEFPYCIARRFNVNQDELMSLNGLSAAEASNLQAGKVLQIPQTGNAFVGERARNPHPASYTVTSANDTVYSIACYYGNVDPSQIIAANGLVSPYTLQINQVLSIP